MATVTPPALREVVDQVHAWYPPTTADSWDAVGLVRGHPDQPVRRVLLAVDPAPAVAEEAAEWDADLLLVHHPLLLRPVHGVPETTPKGRTLGRLAAAGCALLTAHTNADQALGGVSEALAHAVGLTDLSPLRPMVGEPVGDLGRPSGAVRAETGTGRIGTLAPTGPAPATLADFARRVADALPATAHGVRVAGDPDRPVSRVAVCGGAGDFLLDELAESDADVYLTSDLRHHPASEFLERGGPALVDVSHWAAEWTWLPVVQARLRDVLGDTVDVRVSRVVTDPWTFRR